MKKRSILIAVLVLLAVPAVAVFKEKNLNQTLSVLFMELKETYNVLLRFNGSADKRIKEQQQKLANLIDECNELSVMLYSQASENTFDLTFALNEVTSQYEQFKGQSTPYAEVKEVLTAEMDRYSRLVLTLRKMPPERTAEEIVQEKEIAVALDSATSSLPDSTILSTPEFARDAFTLRMDDQTVAVRDSCLYVAEQIVAYYWQQLKQIQEDNKYYDETDERLRNAYDYAQERYKTVQKKLFVEGQGNYFKTLLHFPRRLKRAKADFDSRYSLRLEDAGNERITSSWRGPIVYGYSFMLLLILAFATFIATVIVNKGLMPSRLGKSGWLAEHKGMTIALIGLALFGVFLYISSSVSDNTFIVRSSNIMWEFAWLVAAIFVSMLIRLDKTKIRSTLRAYLPTLIMAFAIIYIRIIFMPNSIINLLFPAFLLIATVAQFWVNSHFNDKVDRGDRALLWGSAAAMTVSTLISWAGVVMGSLLLLIWWMFLLALLETIIAFSELLGRYYEKRIKVRKAEYVGKNPQLPLSSAPGSFIEVTWLYDLLKMAVIPILGIGAFPAAVFMACRVFNFTTVAHDIFFKPFIELSEKGFHLSLFHIVMVAGLFFAFRYLEYALKAFYRVWKTKAVIRKLGPDKALKETDINYNLVNNIISLLLWGLYVITVFLLLRIPSSGLALVSTGLATGVGFALKDILNNFFYGIQLMGGRVRVGDTVECDGVRGTVVGLGYQTTQIEAIDGSIMFFTNSALFNNNFKNLTRNNSYQLVTFTVGVKYGTDVEKARQVILDALQPLMVKDKYGREIIDKKRGVTVRLSNFGDSSVDLLVLLHTTVDTFGSLPARAREAIYKAFAENGIEIPFPQRDVHVIND